jgi:TPR repeat protein
MARERARAQDGHPALALPSAASHQSQMAPPTRQATAAGSATLVAPDVDAPATGRREAKRPAASTLETEQHKRFRLTLEKQADEWLCPITHELPLDPVMAEDLRFYDRASNEESFKRNNSAVRSPVINEPMGLVLKSVPQVRNTIQDLVESGAITGDRVESWKKRLAQEEEVKRVRQRATAGEVDAMRQLGRLYFHGEKGLPNDDAQAFSWFKRAADLADAIAMAFVGNMYCIGKGVTPNVNRGTVHMSQAAALCSEWGCYLLGSGYKDGNSGLTRMLQRRPSIMSRFQAARSST